MLFDSHFHTEFSSDSDLKLEEALKYASELNFGLISTEHFDYDFEGDLFKFDIDEYFKKYSKYKDKNYLLGVEIGLTSSSIEANKSVANNNFDFIIGSIHFLDNQDIYYYLKDIDKPKNEVFENYLNTTIENLEKVDFIDSLGHIDYPCRYVPYEDKNLYYNNHPKLFDKLFKLLVEKNIVMEINTRRLNDESAFNSLLEIYKKYSEAGGKYVTIGSDAHTIEQIGANFGKALKLARLAKLTPVYFKNREKFEMKYE